MSMPAVNDINPPKTVEQHFRDWESSVFGYGYGTGEDHTVPALKQFFTSIGREEFPNGYDCSVLEATLGPVVAWLLINILCKDDIIEYGTSPRYGWLTPHGVRLRQFIDSKTAEQLIEIVSDFDENYSPCYEDHCNCGRCAEFPNPFWE